MSLLLDECTPRLYLELLREWGYEANLVREFLEAGDPDTEILLLAQRLDAVVLSVDMDFADITRFPPHNYAGIIVIRDEQQKRELVKQQLKQALHDLYRDALRGALVIVTAEKYRVRGDG